MSGGEREDVSSGGSDELSESRRAVDAHSFLPTNSHDIDWGGVISVLFAIMIFIILVGVSFGHATLTDNLKSIISLIIGYIFGRFMTVE